MKSEELRVRARAPLAQPLLSAHYRCEPSARKSQHRPGLSYRDAASPKRTPAGSRGHLSADSCCCTGPCRRASFSGIAALPKRQTGRGCGAPASRGRSSATCRSLSRESGACTEAVRTARRGNRRLATDDHDVARICSGLRRAFVLLAGARISSRGGERRPPRGGVQPG